jgi:hypothetical protein
VQVLLQLPDVGLADAQLVQQVARAGAVVRLDELEFVRVFDFEGDGAVTQIAQRGKRALDETVGGHRAGNSDWPGRMRPDCDDCIALSK